MRLWLPLGLMGLVGAALPVAADPAIAAWEQWMAKNRIPAGQISVWEDGAEIAAAQIGIDKTGAIGLASVSKTVVAACVHALVERGRVSWSDPTARHLDIGDDRTVLEFALHTGGLGADRTQDAPMARWRGPENDAAWSEEAFARAAEPRGTYRYSNENYAILGAVLETQVGDIVPACRETLAMPSLTRSQGWPGAGAFGGLAASAYDIAHLATQWASHAPDTIGTVPVRDTISYVPGAVSAPLGTGRAYWHGGRLCDRPTIFHKARGTGAYWVSYGTGRVVAMTHAACLGAQTLDPLDEALMEIATQAQEGTAGQGTDP
ncbi:MAG: serine hydrolase domain-containing protein [Pseudomonadota bacterium]